MAFRPLHTHPEGIGMENLSAAKRVFLSLTQNPKTESEFMTFAHVLSRCFSSRALD